jgi:hypothetical protein
MATSPLDREGDVWSAMASRSASESVSSELKKKRVRDSNKPRRRDDEGDDAFDPGDDSDLGLDGEGEDEESFVGLDPALGFDDADDLELPDDGEDQRWSVDSEEVGDLPGMDSDLFGDEEYGWLGDDDSPNDDESFDADIDEDEDESGDDGGAEGLEDDSELDDLDLGDLPAMDADVEEDSAAVSGEALDELVGLSLVDEPSIEIASGELWKLVPAQSVRVSELRELQGPVRALCASGGAMFIAAAGLYRVSADGELKRLPRSAAAPSALAVCEHEGVQHVAVVAAGRVLSSRDGGHTFEPVETGSPVTQIAFTRSSAGPRLWWRNARGGLGAVGGQGGALAAELEGEISAFRGDGKRSLAVLLRRSGRLQLMASGDAGKRFARVAPPPTAADAHSELHVCRDAVLFADAQDARCALLPSPLEPVATRACAPAALSDEDDEAFAYGCVTRGDELLIVRRSARARGSAPLVVAVIERARIPTPQLMAASYSEGGAVSVYLASATTLLRIEVSLDGEELA